MDTSCRRDAEDQPHHDAEHRAEQGDRDRLQPHHLAQLPSAHPDRAQQADLAGPLDHREREGVDDAEHRDEIGQAEQRVDDVQELVDLLLLLVGERLLVLQRDGRAVGAMTSSIAALTVGVGGTRRSR